MTTLIESTEKAYCHNCGKHWNAAVIEDGICQMCWDLDMDEN